MRRQRNTQQMKEQGKNLQEQLNEEEIGNLPEKQFRVMISEKEERHRLRKYKKRLTRT